MRSTNSKSLDTRLMIALVALVEERSVSRAALREALSQPSMSRLLARLRQITGDPVLRKAGNGFAPTEKAIALAQSAADILARTAALTMPRAYDPSADVGLVRFAASDYGEALILSRVVIEISRVAPGISIQVANWDANTIEDLRMGRLDFALGVADPALGSAVVSTALQRDHLVGVARRNHPILGRKIRLADYSAQGHVIVSTGAGAVVAGDTALRKRGFKRTIVCRTRNFLGAARLVSGSDLVTATPERLAKWLTSTFPLQTFKLPFPSPSFQYSLLSTAQIEFSERHRWIRKLVVDASQVKSDP